MSGTHPLVRIETALLIAVGGFAGSNLRYAAEQAAPSSFAATLVVNVLGSFALAVLLYEAIHLGVLSVQTSTVFGTGFLSSFTTYSTFALQTFTVPEYAVGYVAASYLLGFAAVCAGRSLVRRLGGS
ncbi:fluoride efflux transporter FluC [Halegenticoccus tardaugens]|uniref:fluoride efflux transporter FluC n=1 Tax=Halegenticoccus tardaugens TaxID=2071624 RepID=UPI00100B8AE7|nr:CrcB family protein [Halegenticoccus tardaugens]